MHADAAEQVDTAIRGAVKAKPQSIRWLSSGNCPAGLPELEKPMKSVLGGVAEWFKAPVLKTGVGASSPWVRIPPPPP